MSPLSPSSSSASSSKRKHRVQIRHAISSDGSAIYADAQGDAARKPALVFIHGYTLCAAVWDNLFADPRLADNFFLVRYDVRGHGRSAKPKDMSGYASKLYADDFAAVCETFGVKRPIAVAWSLGGTVIADIASHLPPSTLAGVAYLAPCPYIGPIMLSIGTPFILQLLTTLGSSPDALAQEEALDAFAKSCFADPEVVDWRLKVFWRGMGASVGREQRRFVTSREQNPEGLFALAAGKAVDFEPASSSSSASAEARRARVPVPPLPTLLQIGEKDPQIFPERLEAELRPHFADLEFVVHKGRGHTLHVECQKEVVDRLVGFAGRVFGLPPVASRSNSSSNSISNSSKASAAADGSPASVVKSLSTSTEGSGAGSTDDEDEEDEEDTMGRKGSNSSSTVVSRSGPTVLLRALSSVRYAIGTLFGSR